MRKIWFLLMCLLFALATTPVHADHQRTILQVGEATMFVEQGSEFELDQLFHGGYGLRLLRGKVLVKGEGSIETPNVRQSEWRDVVVSGSTDSIFQVVVSSYGTKVNVIRGWVHMFYPFEATLLPCYVATVDYPRFRVEKDCPNNSSFEDWAMNTESSASSHEVIIERQTEYIVVRTYVPAWGGYHNIHYYCDPYGDCDYLLHRNGYFTYAVGVGWVWVPYDYFWQNVYCYDYDNYYIVTHYHQPEWRYYHHYYHGQTPPQPQIVKQASVRPPVVKQKIAPMEPANAPISKEVKREYTEPGDRPKREKETLQQRRVEPEKVKPKVEKLPVEPERNKPNVERTPVEKKSEPKTEKLPPGFIPPHTSPPEIKPKPEEKEKQERPVMEHKQSRPAEQPPVVKPAPKDEPSKEKPANKKEPEKKKASPKTKEKKDKEEEIPF